jgi:hypothetical protein
VGADSAIYALAAQMNDPLRDDARYKADAACPLPVATFHAMQVRGVSPIRGANAGRNQASQAHIEEFTSGYSRPCSLLEMQVRGRRGISRVPGSPGSPGCQAQPRCLGAFVSGLTRRECLPLFFAPMNSTNNEPQHHTI